MRKILITGGAGFIGSNLANALLNKGHSIRILDNLSPQIHGHLPYKYDWLDELIKNIDIITNSDNTINIYMCKNNEYENHKKLYDLSHSKINNDKSYNLTY